MLTGSRSPAHENHVQHPATFQLLELKVNAAELRKVPAQGEACCTGREAPAPIALSKVDLLVASLKLHKEIVKSIRQVSFSQLGPREARTGR